ncbi:cortical protein marker for cell polarity-domain-containing protein [Plectosphaerella plurivora]|uniref:Cortical protein marker for cell polarity-domain-containing protein n=1 Tax=Plectosphaerella plurivora TaxID=936078 RepID=A0A9P9AEK0_9PEZI|nr:cortical protein marker for cell polarity-domain-containing protein [Plectosphaerella plurivora]
MRLPFRRRPATRRHRQSATSDIIALAAIAPALASALDFTPVPEANLDLSRLGRIGVAGDFNGISLYEFEEQNERPVTRNGSEALLARLPNGAFATIASTDASIHDMCASYLNSGDMAGVVLAGNFTSVDGIASQGVALFNVTSSSFVPLEGLTGQVNALLCDGATNRVYVGGSFRHTNSSNALMWVHGQGWTPLPFAGFNGPVSSITKASNDHIIFGGSFTGLGNLTSSSNTEGQVINLSSANITSGSSTSTTGFSDPRNIVCKTDGADGAGNTWLLQDGAPGFWGASFGFGFEPTKLRIWNTHQDGRGTRTWRFTAFPINGILNMTYVDPATGQNASCTSECPLSDNPDVPFQDFHFVNSVGLDSFRIDISEFYGAGGGLNGIQLYSEDAFAYAINDFNEPSCDGAGVQLPSSATTTGPWRESPSLQSSSRYLTADLSGDISESSASVTFFPNIADSGNYTVEMYTPGCLQDDTCATRGQVNITGIMTSAPDGRFTTSLYQTNNFDKYDPLYFGFVEGGSAGGFRPSITLTPLAGQSLENMTIVAQRVGFTLLSSTGGLNGLFDFDPSATDIDRSDFSKSAINSLGSGFSANSAVHAMTTMGDVVVIAGNFTSNNARNVVGVNTADQTTSPLDGGLNGEVRAMHLEAPLLYAGGSFDNILDGNATGLDNVAVYNSNDDAWSALGGGVNGKVLHVVPMQVNLTGGETEVAIAFTGSFDQINAFGDNLAVPASGFAIWVPSQRNWLPNLAGPVPSFNGILTAAVLELPEDSTSLFAGSMSSASISANGAVTLGQTLGQFPVRIEAPSVTSSSLARRDLLSSGNVTGVVAGAFYEENGKNITVLAGHFTARTGDGTEVNNLVFIDNGNNDAVTGLGSDIPDNSTFVALALVNGRLFAGGDVSGQIDGEPISGLVSYDLANNTLGPQVPGLNGGNATVSAIQVRPDTGEVYVAGTFQSAGALDCPGICYYNTELSQWNRPGSTVQGTASALLWASNSRLIVGGDMRVNDSSISLAIYDAEQQSWSSFPGQENLPGPVNVMTRGSQDGNQIWVSGPSPDGSVYLMKYDGSNWHSAQTLESGTQVYSLQMFSITSNHGNTDTLSGNQVLMLTGSIALPNFGTAAAAIFNGSAVVPYALTAKSGSTAGTVSGIFTQNTDFFTDNSGNLALVFVVLIGLAIALGLMFLLIIAGVLLDRLRKKREGYTPAPTSMYDRGSGLRRIPPQELFQSLRNRGSGAPQI